VLPTAWRFRASVIHHTLLCSARTSSPFHALGKGKLGTVRNGAYKKNNLVAPLDSDCPSRALRSLDIRGSYLLTVQPLVFEEMIYHRLLALVFAACVLSSSAREITTEEIKEKSALGFHLLSFAAGAEPVWKSDEETDALVSKHVHFVSRMFLPSDEISIAELYRLTSRILMKTIKLPRRHPSWKRNWELPVSY
jgi:hypothetical protein